MGFEACEAMATFSNKTYCSCGPFETDDEVFYACLRDANIAKALVQWCELLKWPQDIQPDCDMHAAGDWGISWFELLVSFYITTGWRGPIRVEGAGAQSKYLDYGDAQATLLQTISFTSDLVFSKLVAECLDGCTEGYPTQVQQLHMLFCLQIGIQESGCRSSL